MPVIPVPASGGAPILPYMKKSIRLIQFGCRNRPFFHIVVMDTKKDPWHRCIEQVGTFDPMPNEKNERIVAFNFERIRYWMGEGAAISDTTAQLLGLSGFLPIHPRSYMKAWREREEEPADKIDRKWELRKEEIIEKARKYREDKEARQAEKLAEEELAQQEQVNA